jgi:hypothetical protein
LLSGKVYTTQSTVNWAAGNGEGESPDEQEIRVKAKILKLKIDFKIFFMIF